MTHSDGQAFGLLLTDLLQTILASADNPASTTARLSEQLRSFVGVKTLAVFQCLLVKGRHEHKLLSVTPQRRRTATESPAMRRVVDLAHELDSLHLLGRPNRPAASLQEYLAELEPDHSGSPDVSAMRPGSAGGAADPGILAELESLLREQAAGLTMIVPLRYQQQRSGVMLLMGLMDEQHLDNLLQSLDRLSGVLALVLRNAVQYEELDSLVRARTGELEARQKSLESALEANLVLFKEVHHRVKNNLQIIDSLLFMQSDSLANTVARAALLDARNRIRAMALVHAELYHSYSLSSIDLRDYVPNLVSSIMSGFPDPPEVALELASCRLGMDQMIPIGLILNELLTNSVKYGRQGPEELRVAITASRVPSGLAVLVRDSGPGFPPGFEPERSTGLGMSIIRALAEQLHAALSWRSGPGLECSLLLPPEVLSTAKS